MSDTPGKRALYICLIGVAFVPVFANPYQVQIGALGSMASLLLVMRYIRSDRKRNEARRRGFPVLPKEPSKGEPGDSPDRSTRL